MVNYLKQYLKNTARTPQSEPLPKQVANSAGGYSFAVDDWTRLDRFLVLGSEGGSYYAKERKLTAENAAAVKACIAVDGPRVVARIAAVSLAGRAPKNDPALLALALCFALGDEATKRAAAEALPQVCRIGTHLLHFAEYVNGLRGWGRGLRRAVGTWYTGKPARDVAFQAVKYANRDGWTHRDLLRLAHPQPPTEEHQVVFNYIAKGWPGVGDEPHPLEAARVIWATERAKATTDKTTLIALLREYKLQREMLPTPALADPAVWEALLPNLGLTALIRNLGNLSKIGLLATDRPDIIDSVIVQITSQEGLRKARIHPIAVLTALMTYKNGHGVKGKGVWQPVPKVVDALDAAFYKAFGNVEPANKRLLLALDVSGSMTMGSIAGIQGLTPRVGSAAMALVTAATEPNYTLLGFSHELVEVPITPRMRLDQAVAAIDNIPMGGTDCALPMLWAAKHRAQVDTFVVYTDSETWAGAVHPVQALRDYREQSGIPARLLVVGMVANAFSIADPNDAGMLDVVGFDTATPQLISDFARE